MSTDKFLTSITIYYSELEWTEYKKCTKSEPVVWFELGPQQELWTSRTKTSVSWKYMLTKGVPTSELVVWFELVATSGPQRELWTGD